MTTTHHILPMPGNGCDRCECGCKYWEGDTCIDCGAAYVPNIPEGMVHVRKGTTVSFTGPVVLTLWRHDAVSGWYTYAELSQPTEGAPLYLSGPSFYANETARQYALTGPADHLPA